MITISNHILTIQKENNDENNDNILWCLFDVTEKRHSPHGPVLGSRVALEICVEVGLESRGVLISFFFRNQI